MRKSYLRSFIALACGILILLCIDHGHNWGGDFALYISQTQALLSGSVHDLFEANKFAMDHSIRHIGPYLYPMGFPILLIPLYFLFGMNFWAMKVFCGAFLVGSVFLLYEVFNERFPARFFAFFIIVFIALNAIFVTHANAVLSDLPFFFFSLLTFFLMGREHTLLNQLLLGCCLVMSYLIRDVGIVLVPTLFVYQAQLLFHRKEATGNWLFFGIPYLIFVIGFTLNYFFMPRGGENALSVFLANLNMETLVSNGKYYLKLIVSFFIDGIIPSNVLFLLLSPIILFMGLGAITSWKGNLHFLAYIALTFAILLIWPYCIRRFLYPVLPFLLFFMLKGMVFLADRLRFEQGLLIRGLSVFLAIHVVVNLITIFQYARMDTNKILTPEMIGIYERFDETVPPDQIIGFRKPRVLRLMTNINSVKMDETSFDASVADYLLIEKEETTDAIQRYETNLETANFLFVQK